MDKRGLAVVALAVATAIGHGCSKGPAPARSEAEAFRAARAAYRAAETPEEKAKVGEDYLAEFPGGAHSAAFAEVVIESPGRNATERRRAYDIVHRALERAADPAVRFQLGLQLFGLSYEVGQPLNLEKLADELAAKRGLTFSENLDVAKAAAKQSLWTLTEKFAYLALAQAAPGAYRAEHGNGKADEKQIAKAVQMRSAFALGYQAWAEFNLGREDEAEDLFKRADRHLTFNYLGIPDEPVRRLWARAEIARGNWARAIALLEPSAVLGGDPVALADLRRAWAGRAGSAKGFDAYLWQARRRLAHKVDDFRLADYSGAEHALSEDRGKVILLAFWFPT